MLYAQLSSVFSTVFLHGGFSRFLNFKDQFSKSTKLNAYMSCPKPFQFSLSADRHTFELAAETGCKMILSRLQKYSSKMARGQHKWKQNSLKYDPSTAWNQLLSSLPRTLCRSSTVINSERDILSSSSTAFRKPEQKKIQKFYAKAATNCSNLKQ